MHKYTVVGANPIKTYTGTTSYSALKIVGYAATREELQSLVDETYDQCGGLMLVIDNETGKEQTDE